MAVTLPLLVLLVLFSNANAACNKNFTLSSDTFATENFPNRNFTGYCHYQIKLPFRRAIDLQWLAFDVGSPKVNSKCPDNYVTVYDGAMLQPQHTYTFCGKQPQNITSKTNILSIILYVNSNRSHHGFRVKYTSHTVTCPVLYYSGINGILTNPNFPNSAPAPYYCTRVITVPENNLIKIDFLTFSDSSNLYPNSKCKSGMKLYDGSYNVSENQVYKFCAYIKSPPSFTSSSNMVSISFYDNHNSGGNLVFAFSYQAVPRKSCNYAMKTQIGSITIPSTPSYDHSNLTCVTLLEPPAAKYLILQWNSIGENFRDPQKCDDFVEVYLRNISSSTLYTKLCNATRGTTISMRNLDKKIFVRYVTKNYNSRKQFNLRYYGVSKSQVSFTIRQPVPGVPWCFRTLVYYNTTIKPVLVDIHTFCSSPSSSPTGFQFPTFFIPTIIIPTFAPSPTTSGWVYGGASAGVLVILAFLSLMFRQYRWRYLVREQQQYRTL